MTNPMELFTPFLPSTFNVPDDPQKLKDFIVDEFTSLSDVINDKKIGLYTQGAENFNGESWFYRSTKVDRNGYQTMVYIPSLPNTTTLVIDANTNPSYPITDINNEFVITNLYGTASKPPTIVGAGDGDFFKFNNQGDSRITFTMTDTVITITTTTDLSAYLGLIVIHYLRNGV